MNVVSYSCKPYDKQALNQVFDVTWQSLYLDVPLNLDSIGCARGAEVVTAFVNDRLDAEVLTQLVKEPLIKSFNFWQRQVLAIKAGFCSDISISQKSLTKRVRTWLSPEGWGFKPASSALCLL